KISRKITGAIRNVYSRQSRFSARRQVFFRSGTAGVSVASSSTMSSCVSTLVVVIAQSPPAAARSWRSSRSHLLWPPAAGLGGGTSQEPSGGVEPARAADQQDRHAPVHVGAR